MICSSVNFDRFMVRSSPWAGLKYQMEELSGVRASAARLVFETEGHLTSRWQAVMSITGKIDCTAQTLYEWVKKAKVDTGRRVPTVMAKKMKAL